MSKAFASFVLFAALHSLTASGQTLVEFSHNGTAYVGIPVPIWEEVVAKRLSSNELNRMRARSIALLKSDVADVERISETYRQDAIDAKKKEAAAYAERDKAIGLNAELTKKLKRRTPWATAMKVQVCAVALVGAIVTYQELKP